MAARQRLAERCDELLSREWCGGSSRALQPRQRKLRLAALLLLSVESVLVLAAIAELADDDPTRARSSCGWCAKLNCAPMPWWDCSAYEVQTVPRAPPEETPSNASNASLTLS